MRLQYPLGVIVVSVVILSCGSVASDDAGTGGAAASPSGGSAGTAGAGGGQGGSAQGGSAQGGSAGGGTGGVAGSGGKPYEGVFCAGSPCAPNEDCCLVDGTCFDPVADPGACAAPTTPGRRGLTSCTASSQCNPGEYCATQELCLGPGLCQSLTNCGSSSGMPMCGCDGVTYPDVQTACAVGVTIVGPGECGKPQVIGAGGSSAGKTVTYCATAAQCAAGEACCSITGQCHDASEPALCAFPPEGTTFPCVDDSQCYEGYEYCHGDGCSGPGGCKAIPSTCSGELEPVCGCDGQSYVNAGCAAAAGVRVDHPGECAP